MADEAKDAAPAAPEVESEDEFDPAEMAQRAADVTAQRKEAKRILMGQYKSNISYGFEGWKPEAGHKADFPKHNLSTAASNAAEGLFLKKENQKAHYEFGEDSHDWKTTAGLSFVDRGGKPSVLSEVQKAEVRSVHFEFGMEPPMYESTASAAFNRGGKAPKMDLTTREESKRLKRDLEATHYMLGEDTCDWSTTGKEFVHHKIDVDEAVKNAEGIRVMTTLLRSSNIQYSSVDTFYDMRQKMPDPRDDPDAYKSDSISAMAKERMKRDCVVLGEDDNDWRTEKMVDNGQRKIKLNRPFKPGNLGHTIKRPGAP